MLRRFYKTGRLTMLPPTIKVKKAFELYQVDVNGFREIFSEMNMVKNQWIKEHSSRQQHIIEIYLILADIVLLDKPFAQLSLLMIEKFSAVIEQQKTQKAIFNTDHWYKVIWKVPDQISLFQNQQTNMISSKTELIKIGVLTSLNFNIYINKLFFFIETRSKKHQKSWSKYIKKTICIIKFWKI